MGISICGKFKQDKNSSNLMSPNNKFSRKFTRLSKLNDLEDSKKNIETNNSVKITNFYKASQIISDNKNIKNNYNENILLNLENEPPSPMKNSNQDINLNLSKTKTIQIKKSSKVSNQINNKETLVTNTNNNINNDNYSKSLASHMSKDYNESSMFLSFLGECPTKILQRRIMNDKMEEIQKKFFISMDRILELYKFFMKIDSNKSGYISIFDLYKLIDEHPTSSHIGPFIDRFFVLIEKRNFDKASFEELLPNLLSFCLFSVYQIIEFVFHFIDKDHDNCISKKDIKYIISLQREDSHIYFENNIQALENFRFLKRADKIHIEDFVILCQKLPFIYYPAIRLQSLLKEHYIGTGFWNKLQKEVKEKYLLNIKSLENEKIQNKIQQIKDKLIEERKKKLKEMMEKNREVKIYFQDMRLERRNSDTNFFLVLEKDVVNGLQKDEELLEAKSFDENIYELKFD